MRSFILNIEPPLPKRATREPHVTLQSAKIDILIARDCSQRKFSNLHVALVAKLLIAGRFHSRMLDIVFRDLVAVCGID
jgi:hypothetical protein